jgi:polyhydroxyalkanoate synthase
MALAAFPSRPPAGRRAPGERRASAWQGETDRSAPAEPAPLDLLLNAGLGKLTGYVSPVALGMAYADWLGHLALSPSHVSRLAQRAWQQLARWQQHALQASQEEAPQPHACIAPLPQDKRFTDPAWRQWPYSVLVQGFLLQQQWWHCATTGVRGVSPHHENVVNFTTRQLLDMMAPSNFVATNPQVLQETLRRGGANLVNGAAAALSDWRRMLEGPTAPPDPRFVPGRGVAVTPGAVVYRNELMELIQYAPATGQVHAGPLLIVPAWIMKYYILDLAPEHSLVRYLVEQGYTVFMISWVNPGEAERELSMEDYRLRGVMAALDEVVAITSAPAVNAAGYCLGGTLLAIAAAAMARDGDQRLASVTLLAAQADFTEPGELSLFIDDSQVSFLEAAMWQRGYLDTAQMAGAFQLLRSNDLIWSRRLRQYLLDQPAVETDLTAWNADATRMPYRMHSEYLRRLFLQNELARNLYQCGGKPVSLNDLRTPVFAVGTVTDHVAPWRSVYKLLHLTDTDATFLLASGGHNAGVVSPPGRAGASYQLAHRQAGAPYADADAWLAAASTHQGSWWPAWSRWLRRHAGALIAPPPMGEALAPAPGSYVLQR